jgi:hypothetical protein
MAAGIATLYCRPFTDNDLIGKLNQNLVPQKFKELHANLFELRNKAFAKGSSPRSSPLLKRCKVVYRASLKDRSYAK